LNSSRGRHATPLDIACVLARHASRHISSILEPAVGTGILLQPLIERLKKSAKQIVCIDSDPNALSIVRKTLGKTFHNSLQLVSEDFLKWSERFLAKKGKSFDCVLMNPPFSGRRGLLVRLELDRPSRTISKTVGYVPIEVAFVIRGVKLLKPGGRLLAIVPSSLVSSSGASWVRNYLLSIGFVRFVHELPRFTFKDVEARVYLFVFEKGTTQGSLTLCNHDLYKPEKLVMPISRLNHEARFDYSFNQARLWLQDIRSKFPSLEWTELKNVAFLYRGSEESPDGPKNAIHTCDWNDGFWDSENQREGLKQGNGDRCIKRGDLLVRRVGRSCVQSLGPIRGYLNHACSDCIYLIRPNPAIASSELLFALRILVACSKGAALVERGTGATYITEQALLELPVPTALRLIFGREFKSYLMALRRKDPHAMRSIEKKTRHILTNKTEKVLGKRKSSGTISRRPANLLLAPHNTTSRNLPRPVKETKIESFV